MVTAVIQPFDPKETQEESTVLPSDDEVDEKEVDVKEEEEKPKVVQRPTLNKTPSTNGKSTHKPRSKVDKNKPFSKKQNKRRN
jgi:hypothetical protein